jgi:hypothetical protein
MVPLPCTDKVKNLKKRRKKEEKKRRSILPVQKVSKISANSHYSIKTH